MIARNDGAKLSSLTNDRVVLPSERVGGTRGWTSGDLGGFWRPTRSRIGNRSDPHGKRCDARPFLINRQPLPSSLSYFFLPSEISSRERSVATPIVSWIPFDDDDDDAARLTSSRSEPFNRSCEIKLVYSASERVSNNVSPDACVRAVLV